MRQVLGALARLPSLAARLVLGAFRAVGAAVLFGGGLLEPGSGAWPEPRLSLLVGAFTVGVLGLAYLLYGP